MPTYAASKPGYRALWTKVEVTRAVEAKRAAERILRFKKRYQAVEGATGVPWYWIAVVHMRESNNSFDGVLHNGDTIIGIGELTTHVPKGRGPFASWGEAVIDALQFKKLDRIGDWPIERVLYEMERYNGWGYFGKINSPYVWGGTSLQQRGKYLADGKYDPNHTDKQLGTAAALKQLMELDGSIAEDLGGNAPGEVVVPPGGEDTVSERYHRRELLKLDDVKSVLVEYAK